jgi:glutamate-1-semialdehyde 2,1-aminomutase
MAKNYLKSKILFDQAKEILVGGVDSPVRAFKSVGGHPIFMKSAKGPYLYSEDGDTYIDYVLSWGPHILGHQHPVLVDALLQEIKNGLSYGTPSRLEAELAKLVQYFFPSMQKIRFVNSGTEATMSMIRLARGATGRSLIVKFEGCYHGHVDSLLVSSGSGGLTLGVPDSAGVLDDTAKHTVVLEYNNPESVTSLFKEKGNNIAGIILEPVCGNMGVVLPKDDFLDAIQVACNQYQSLLLFDEVMTGWRVGLNGVQGLKNIKPDLTALGKIIGGGLPCGAYGGRSDIMAHVAPEGTVYQAGTLSGNPVVMTAGLSVLSLLKEHPSLFETAKKNTEMLIEGIRKILIEKNLNYQIQHCGTLFSLFFTEKNIQNLSDVKTCNIEKFNHYYHAMLAQGIYLAPSQFESNFMSSAHSEENIHATLAAMRLSLI